MWRSVPIAQVGTNSLGVCGSDLQIGAALSLKLIANEKLIQTLIRTCVFVTSVTNLVFHYSAPLVSEKKKNTLNLFVCLQFSVLIYLCLIVGSQIIKFTKYLFSLFPWSSLVSLHFYPFFLCSCPINPKTAMPLRWGTTDIPLQFRAFMEITSDPLHNKCHL